MLHEACVRGVGGGGDGIRVDELVRYPEGDFVDEDCDDKEGVDCLCAGTGFIEFFD